jgi:hypothetical protein
LPPAARVNAEALLPLDSATNRKSTGTLFKTKWPEWHRISPESTYQESKLRISIQNSIQLPKVYQTSSAGWSARI